ITTNHMLHHQFYITQYAGSRFLPFISRRVSAYAGCIMCREAAHLLSRQIILRGPIFRVFPCISILQSSTWQRKNTLTTTLPGWCVSGGHFQSSGVRAIGRPCALLKSSSRRGISLSFFRREHVVAHVLWPKPTLVWG